MADYLPYASPGEIVTFLAGEAITGGALVMVGAADMTVIGATNDTDKWVGVAARDAASGAEVGVYIPGMIHRLKAKGAITRGDLVSIDSTDADGEVATAAAVTDANLTDATVSSAAVNLNARALVGLALESVADDAVGRFLFR